MPGLLSGIPGLSSLPNPLNLFNSDDAPTSPSANSNSRLPPTSPGMNSSSSSAPNAEAGPSSKFASIFSKGIEVFTLNSNPSTPVRANGAAPETDSGTPTPMRPALRTEIANGSSSSTASSARPSPPIGSGSTNVVIANREGAELEPPPTITDAGRRRGLSSASRGSGGNVGTNTRQRNRRIETFVLVKPPPTSAKNPLNLQVQLVVQLRTAGRPRGGSDAASKAMIPPLPTQPSSSSSAVDDVPSAPSTPARRSFETPVDKTSSGDPDATASTPSGSSVTSDLLLSDECAPLPTVPESEAEAKLRRRSSTGSQISTGAASMISSASGKQRIVPLYNLAVHNVVQPTTVTDAGTDSKVAKFLKRSLDITGVGILEPSEVWLPLPHSSGSMFSGNSPRPSFDTSSTRLPRPASMISNMSSLSPAITRVEDQKRVSTDVKPLKLEVRQEDGPKKFFGKIFRKRGSAEPLPESRSRRGSIVASRPTTVLATEAGSSLKVPSTPPPPAVHFSGTELVAVSHPTFGLAPSMLARNSSATNLDQNGAIVGLTAEVPKPAGYESEEVRISRSGRPIGYTWTVRRWAKKNAEGWAAHIVAAAAAGLDMVANAIPGDGADEVVFEWVKMRITPTTEAAAAALRRHPASEGVDGLKRRGGKMTPSASPRGSPTGSRVNLAMPSDRATRQGTVAVEASKALLEVGTVKSRMAPSPSPKRRVSPPRIPAPARPSDEGSSGNSDVNLEANDFGPPAVREPSVPSSPDDDGYDSDPEDSETPWICSVWVKRTGQRQLLASLTPAPHHPKVIGVLRIPNQLKGVSLTDLPAGSGGKQNDLAARIRDEVCLTEENLKDVVSVTAMWLVAREEFSGFGRKDKRKA